MVVARLSSSYAIAPGLRCLDATVAAVTVRRRDETPPQYLDRVHCDEWEIALAELVLEPIA